MKLALINDTEHRENLGCRLTSGMFKRSLTRVLPKAEFLASQWGFQLKLPHSGLAWRAGLGFPPTSLSERTLRTLAAAEYGRSAVDHLSQAQGVVFHAEGTLSDRFSALQILRVLSLPLLAALHGRVPVVVVNGTIPLYSDNRAALVRCLLRAVDHVALRDRISAEYWGTDFCPDAAVMWQGAPAKPAADMMLLTTAAGVPAARDLAFMRTALVACANAGLKPLVLTKNATRFSAARADVEGLGGTILNEASLNDADGWISRCRLHVGGRYHMALMAATKGIPSVLIRSNTHKNVWLAEELPGVRLAASLADVPEAVNGLLASAFPDGELLAKIGQLQGLHREGIDRAAMVLSHPRKSVKRHPWLPAALSLRLTARAQRERTSLFLRGE